MTHNHRHNIWVQADLWRAVEQAALQEGVRQGRAVSVSEWIRGAIEARLAGEKYEQSDR